MPTSGQITPLNRDNLPDLTDIFFIRPANRRFITGDGGLAPMQSPVRRRFSEIALVLCLLFVAGLGVAALLHPALGGRLAATVALPLIAAGCLWFVMRDQRQRARMAVRLEKEGRLLRATLTASRFVTSRKQSSGSLSPGAVLQLRYRFTTPDGQPFEKRETVDYLPFDLKTVPPAGTAILILYVNREICTAL